MSAAVLIIVVLAVLAVAALRSRRGTRPARGYERLLRQQAFQSVGDGRWRYMVPHSNGLVVDVIVEGDRYIIGIGLSEQLKTRWADGLLFKLDASDLQHAKAMARQRVAS